MEKKTKESRMERKMEKNRMETGKKMVYEAPTVRMTRIVLEEGIAAGVCVSARVYIKEDWKDGGTVGTDTPMEGGDIYLF